MDLENIKIFRDSIPLWGLATKGHETCKSDCLLIQAFTCDKRERMVVLSPGMYQERKQHGRVERGQSFAFSLYSCILTCNLTLRQFATAV